MTALHRSLLRHHIAALALSFVACGVDPPQTESADGVEQEIARLKQEFASQPGTVLVTRSSEMPFSDDILAQLKTADKIIHVYSDGTVIGYLGSAVDHLPEGVPAMRLFRELHGDIVIDNQDLLAGYLSQHEPHKDGIAEAVGLPIGHGALWPDSTVAYVIDGSISDPAQRTAVRNAISAWNRATDPSGNPIKVRFVPRYPGDSRPYVSFVRGGSGPGNCGASQVGRHDNFFTNWWSHDIHLDCFDQRTIIHEMGHTAGLFHEQQRCDRDNFVNVFAPAGGNCERYCGGDHVDYGPYNYLSVMHYPYNLANGCSIQPITPRAAGYHGTPADVGSLNTLDTFDVQGINQMYWGHPSLPTIGWGQFYSLVPWTTPRVVAIPASSTANGVQLMIYDRLPGVLDQHYEMIDVGEGYVQIRPRHAPWKCVEVYGYSGSNGGMVNQWDCHGDVNQQWIVAPSATNPGYFDIINRNSLKSFDVAGYGTANGTPIQQWDHYNGANQRFQLSSAR